MTGEKRRFPAPWRIVEMAGGWQVVDAACTPLAYVYARDDLVNGTSGSGYLSTEEAWRVASNIAKLPELLKR